MVYLIEKAWCDSMENRNDFGYEVKGYVTDLHQAKMLCEEAGYSLSGTKRWSLSYRKEQPVPKCDILKTQSVWINNT